MLLRTDPFRDLDRLTQQMFGTAARPAMMSMDAWRDGDEFVVEFDLPGVSTDSIEIDVERNVLTVRATRASAGDHQDLVASERPRGVFSRQVILGDTLDSDRIRAGYDAGVLVLRIPIAERAKPRRIEIATADPALPQTVEAHGVETAPPGSASEVAASGVPSPEATAAG